MAQKRAKSTRDVGHLDTEERPVHVEEMHTSVGEVLQTEHQEEAKAVEGLKEDLPETPPHEAHAGEPPGSTPGSTHASTHASAHRSAQNASSKPASEARPSDKEKKPRAAWARRAKAKAAGAPKGGDGIVGRFIALFNASWAATDELRDGVKRARADVEEAVGRARRCFDVRARS